MSKMFISPQYLTQQIETNLDLSRSRRSDRPYVTFDLRNVHATPTFEAHFNERKWPMNLNNDRHPA